VLAVVVGGPLGGVALLGAAFVGWAIGHAIAADVCSEPKCRTPLVPGVETCPGCKGSVAGRVRSAAEHWAAAADFRRELAALHAKDEAKAAKKALRGKKTAKA
jgi:hypothetical protein